jgi:hypothetical protein
MRNAATWLALAGATLLAALAFEVPFLRRAFRFGPASVGDLAVAAAAGIASLAWFEALKRIRASSLARR